MASHDDYTADAAHQTLLRFVGTWEGTTRTWLDADGPPEETPTHGTVKSILGGRFIEYEYRGEVCGQSHSGRMLWGHQDEGYRMVLIDSFHTGRGIIVSEGREALSVLGSYQAGEETWGWRTVLSMPGPDEMMIESYNITPAGEDMLGVQTRCRRKQ